MSDTPPHPDLAAVLAAADPTERASVLLHYLAAHPDAPLVLPGASLNGIELVGDPPPMFRDADLREAGFRGAKPAGVVFERANLDGSDFAGADLARALLEDIDLSNAFFRFAVLTKAVLDGSKLPRAERAYLALERNFEALGDPDAADWAYRRRQMEKWDYLARGRREWAAGHRSMAVVWAGRWANMQFVELLCDYGEGIPRVLLSLVALFLAFAVLYGATGSVTRPATAGREVTYHPLDLALYSLLHDGPTGRQHGRVGAGERVRVPAVRDGGVADYLPDRAIRVRGRQPHPTVTTRFTLVGQAVPDSCVRSKSRAQPDRQVPSGRRAGHPAAPRRMASICSSSRGSSTGLVW